MITYITKIYCCETWLLLQRKKIHICVASDCNSLTHCLFKTVLVMKMAKNTVFLESHKMESKTSFLWYKNTLIAYYVMKSKFC